MMKSHKELTVWKRSIELVRAVYRATAGLPRSEIYGLSSQMRRSAVSIPSNISEGQKRGTRKEYTQFVRIAYSSAAELETQLIIAGDLYPNIQFDSPRSLLDEVMRMLNVLIQKLETRT